VNAKPARLIVSVAVVCVVAAVGLALTYSITAPRIAAQEKAAEQDALAAVLPSATTFEPVDDAMLERARKVAGESQLAAVYAAHDASDQFAGWALRVASRGYGGPINMVLGLDRDGKVIGLTILGMNETPGLGTRIKTEPGFLKQFMTLPSGYTEKDVKALDMISGATKSSRGVRNSVAAAGAVYEDVLSGAEANR
jgi:electron transport complex protein RnfG